MLGRGIGNALVVALSAAVGATVAAAILAVGTWPYLFAVNVPLGLGALAPGRRNGPWLEQRNCAIRGANDDVTLSPVSSRGLREDETRWRIGLPSACEHW
jgi:MFS family permease